MIEERLRALAGDVRVEVTGDMAARAAHRARVTRTRQRAALATAVVAVGGTAAVAVPRRAAGPASRATLTPAAPSPTAVAVPVTVPGSGISEAGAARVLERCDAALRDQTEGRESYPQGASVRAYAADSIGATAVIGDGVVYGSCRFYGDEVDLVEELASPAHCHGLDITLGPSDVAGLGDAGAQTLKHRGTPMRRYWEAVGCVSDRVVRVELRLPSGETYDARVAGGVFAWRRATPWVRDTNGTTAPAWAEGEPITFRVYDADRLLQTYPKERP